MMRLRDRGFVSRAVVCGVVASALLVHGGCGPGEGDPNATDQRVIVLGVDGMDPSILMERMRAGEMPNFSKLAKQGGFVPLGTSMPPQSPVAWSDFTTGMNAGGHGIFDFLLHDPQTFALTLSTSRQEEVKTLLGFPVGGGQHVNRRQGRAFWEYLEDREIPATLFKIPSNFPPVGKTSRSFSGMGTPDLRGTPGALTYWTSDANDNDIDTSGDLVRVLVENDVVRTKLVGPGKVLDAAHETSVPITVYIDPSRKVARIDGTDRPVILKPGEWSEWRRVSFTVMEPFTSVTGIVRFYLKSLEPHFKLFATPINIDPASPNTPISTPDSAAAEVQKAAGDFYTKGMPLETNAAREGILNDEEFFAQALTVFRERERLLEHELERFHDRTGFMFFYISTVDLSTHILWRNRDPKHPNYGDGPSDKVKGATEFFYREVDRLLGRVMKEVDDRTTLVVMSDHGFAPYHRTVHLNNWLVKNKYLSVFARDISKANLRDDDNVDWFRSYAYAIGFNGIYLNKFGRQRSGKVTDRDAEEWLTKITNALMTWVDPKTGKNVVSRVYRPEELYSGPFLKNAPDLIVGYARGFRASDRTAQGGFGKNLIEDNLDPWSGDHMMAAEEVPGILLSNKKITGKAPRLVDLPVSILRRFGIDKPKDMTGVNVLGQ